MLRTGAEQVEVEISAARRLAAYNGAVRVPELLGHSSRVLVWSLVEGDSLDEVVRRARGGARNAERGHAALRALGMWTRAVHEGTSTGVATIDLREPIERLDAGPAAASPAAARRRDAARGLLVRGWRALDERPVTAALSLTHGDLTPANVICDEGDGSLNVLDLEHAGERAVVHDLVTLIARLRAHRLDPRTAQGSMAQLEASFWSAYSDVSRELRIAVAALASAWVFYEYLERAHVRADDRGVGRKAMVKIYERFFERRQSEALLQAALVEIEELSAR
jgi:Ser/Thr protein kinase RdoA (MazF antagonist)